MLLKVTPSQKLAYVIADSFVFSFDITNNSVVEKINMTIFSVEGFLLPRAFDITDEFGIVVGFQLFSGTFDLALFVAVFLTLDPLKASQMVYLDEYTELNTASVLAYNRWNDMSVVIHSLHQIVAVGVPLLDTVFLFNINQSSYENELNELYKITPSQGKIGFGRSLAWIEDKQLAVTVFHVPDRPWSKSEMWLFDIDTDLERPRFIFPNHQQTINMVPMALFLHILFGSNNLFILTDPLKLLIIPLSPAGFYSSWNDDEESSLIVFKLKYCVAGTFKNKSDIGPCTVCPPQTKNPGTHPCTECLPCSPNAFCPLASVDDNITVQSYPSYTQTFSYPDTPDTDNYDDLLIQAMFLFHSSSNCLLITPIFWTAIAVGLCIIIGAIMMLIKKDHCHRMNRQRHLIKKFLKATDLIKDGERWIGGLMSLAILVLFGFAFWFAVEYIKLYPIETSSYSRSSCDKTIRNSLFQSSLQLPLPNPDGSRWSIFDMLDEQPLTMAIDLINTRATCSDITIQENRHGLFYSILPINECILQPDNMTRSVSTILPENWPNVQINITGPYFVGGFRLCLRGPNRTKGNNQVHAVDVCQFFSTPNQTLSHSSTLSVVLIRVVNQTKPLNIGEESKYDGRWAPAFVERSISDELMYEKSGAYLRYIVPQTILTFEFPEQPFFLQNSQRPVVRFAQLVFHTLLFCTLVIEIFAMGYLFFKMIIQPIVQITGHCRKQTISPSSLSSSSLDETVWHSVKVRRATILSLRQAFRSFERQKHYRRKKSKLPNQPATFASSNVASDTLYF